jgi:predicted O-methyltransferase YrrM
MSPPSEDPQRRWDAVDDYLGRLLLPDDPALDDARRASRDAGLPDIAVSPTQGALLSLLVSLVQARRVLEIGTLGGYSTIWLARGLPDDGRVVTLEFDPHHAQTASATFARAGLGEVIDVRVGPAIEALPRLAEESVRDGLFDLVFIDADKASMPDYFQWALHLTRPGGAIVADNVVRDGHVIDDESTDASIQGVRRMLDLMSSTPGVRSTAVQTVGSKGYDGFALAFVEPDDVVD